MPVDDCFQPIDHENRGDPAVFQSGFCSVAKAKSADDHLEFFSGCGCQAQSRQVFLGHSEPARHQEGFAEQDLVILLAGNEVPAAAQAEGADRSRPVVQFLEECAQGKIFLLGAPRAEAGRP